MARAVPLLAAILGVLALPGCSTVSSRINQKSAAFVALPSEAQNELRHGRVEPGQTPDLVYIAFGKPASIEQDRNLTTWHYASFLPASLEDRPVTVTFENDRVVGWEKRPLPDYSWVDPDPCATVGPQPYPRMIAPSAVQEALNYTP